MDSVFGVTQQANIISNSRCVIEYQEHCLRKVAALHQHQPRYEDAPSQNIV